MPLFFHEGKQRVEGREDAWWEFLRRVLYEGLFFVRIFSRGFGVYSIQKQTKS